MKAGKTIFRLDPGATAQAAAPDITPMLVAFGGDRGGHGDGCVHDAMFRIMATMVSGLAGH